MTIFTVFFFSLFWLQILNLPASLQNKNTRVGPFPWKRSVLQNPYRERTNQSAGICLRLDLPCNKHNYSISFPGNHNHLLQFFTVSVDDMRFQNINGLFSAELQSAKNIRGNTLSSKNNILKNGKNGHFTKAIATKNDQFRAELQKHMTNDSTT